MPQNIAVATKDRYRELKAMLEERRREILDKLRAIRETMPNHSGEVRDAEEQSVTDFARDMDFALMQMSGETIAKIDEALKRVEAGTYGTCDECGEEISAARLKALPFAVRCVSCQEAEESRRAGEREPARALPPLETV